MRKRSVTRFAEAVAVDTFVTMLNERSQGPNFSWENFPEFVGEKVQTALPFEILEPSDQEETLAIEVAKRWANWAVKRAGLVNP